MSYFRRKIPMALRKRLDSSEICSRLGVVSNPVAERLGRRLAAAVDDFFDEARGNEMLTSRDLSRVIATTIAAWNNDDARREAERSVGGWPTQGNPRDKAALDGELALDVLVTHAAGRNMHTSTYIAQRFRQAGVIAPTDAVDLHLAGRAMSMGLAAYYFQSAIAVADRHGLGEGTHALPVETWRKQLFALTSQLGPDAPPEEEPLREVAKTPLPRAAHGLDEAATMPETQSSSGKIDLFSVMMDKSLSSRIDNKEIGPSARHETQASVRIWLEVLGDRQIDNYTRRDMNEFREVLVQVPKSYWKSQASREKTIIQVIADAKAAQGGRPYQRISNVTVNKHLSQISPFFDWCKQTGYFPKNFDPFWTDMQVRTGKKVTGLSVNEERPAFSVEQIGIIFRHPIWTGRQSVFAYNNPGQVVLRDGLYWGPLIAALHGMRREEFAQLRVRHVKMIDGIWVFDLHHNELSLKNEWSARYVPLHKDLIALGFLEAMVVGRLGEERLFVELAAPPREYGGYGDALGKRFSRVIDDLNIVIMRKDSSEADGAFHPFRHRVISDLLTAGVPPGIVDAVTGHRSQERQAKRVRYTEAVHVGLLKEAIDQVNLPIDIDALIAAWRNRSNKRS